VSELTPEPIYNCPSCSHYLPPGTLACPECDAIIYSEHLRALAVEANTEEQAGHVAESRALWVRALEWLPAGTEQYIAVEQKIAAMDAKMRGADDLRARWTKRLGPLAPVIFFLAKAKSLLFFIFKAKFLLSFLGFFAIYWAIFGWRFGLGFTLGILIHEMGHYVAARSKGLKVDLPVFIPGLGAYVRWYAQGVTLETLSGIALAGPLFGLLVALVCGGIALLTGSPLFSALAHVTAWINVLNLIPVFGLDGAQATFALDKMQRWLVLATALIAFGLLHEGIFLFIVAGMAFRLWKGGEADKPSTRTLLKFVLILFVLGLVIFRFPDTTGRF